MNLVGVGFFHGKYLPFCGDYFYQLVGMIGYVSMTLEKIKLSYMKRPFRIPTSIFMTKIRKI